MTDISNWEYVYKIKNGVHETTNLLYTPKMNKEGTVLCMNWNVDPYQTNVNLTEDLLDFFFEREIKYLSEFQTHSWCPKILDVESKKIFIEWNKESLNHIINSERRLDNVMMDWKEKLLTILKDIDDLGFYKMSLYPHCFFIKDNQLKIIDFYACIEKDHPYIERSKIEGMIGSGSVEFFNNATTNGIIDFSIFFKSTLLHRLSSTWPDNPFPNFYNELCIK